MDCSLQHYKKAIVPKLQTSFAWRNVWQVPRPLKVTVNVGLSRAIKDPRFMDVIASTLTRITGQVPVKTKARASIANFKIRKGQPVGMKVTLRGKRMWDFINKLVNVSFPRIRDFRGIPASAVDTHGNFSYGFPEQTAWPEVAPDEIDFTHGLQVSITTTAKKHEEGRALFEALGFPFKK